MFEILIQEIGERFGLGVKADPLLAALLHIIFDHRTGGGVAGLMARFRQQGLGDLFASWLDNPRPRPIEPRQMEKVLEPGVPADIAHRFGIDRETALRALCLMLPTLIALLTRNGALPTSMPAKVRAYLAGSKPIDSEPVSSKPDVVARAAQTSQPDLTPGLGVFKWIVLAAVLVALGYYLLHRDKPSQNPPVATAPAAGHSAPDIRH